MVEYTLPLDSIFGTLADPTRRDMLQRLKDGELNVSELAAPYDMSLAAISKHLKVMEQAKLIMKRRQGKERIISLQPQTMTHASHYLAQFERIWDERFDRLEQVLKEEDRSWNTKS